jgi:hypothetical protein
MMPETLAPPLESYGTPSAITEADLLAAGPRDQQARPCVCGGVVVAEPVDPTPGVVEHQQTPKHQAWRAWVEA